MKVFLLDMIQAVTKDDPMAGMRVVVKADRKVEIMAALMEHSMAVYLVDLTVVY